MKNTYYSNPTKPVGNYDGNQVPLGPDTINGYGLYDLVGNVAEWTLSLHSYDVENYPQQETIWTNNHVLMSTSERVTRGGTSDDTSHNSHLKIYYRNDQYPDWQDDNGFSRYPSQRRHSASSS